MRHDKESFHLQRLGRHGCRPFQRVVAANEAGGVNKHAAGDAGSGAARRVWPGRVDEWQERQEHNTLLRPTLP
jgi:hypothetical protein